MNQLAEENMTHNESKPIPRMVADAHIAIKNPEVQLMIKRLSEYGLGVMLPHMHDEHNGFVELPNNLIQLEDALAVSFVPRDDERLKNGYAVGWQWDKDKECVVHSCTCGGAPHPSWHK